MNRHPRIFLLIALLTATVLMTSGCTVVEEILGSDRPSAGVSGVRFGNLTTEGAEMLFDVDVKNPYPLPLPLLDAKYSLASGESPFLDGTAPLEGSVPAGGTRTVTLPATINFTKFLNAVKGVRPGQAVPYKADMEVGVDAPALGRLSLPLSRQGKIPVPAVPDVNVREIHWDKLGLTKAQGTVALDLGNTNQFAMGLKNLDYRLQLGGTEIAAGKMAKSLDLEPGESGTLEIPISITPIKLGTAVYNMLKGGEASYAFSGNVEATTPYAPLNLPLNASGQTSITK